MNEKLKTAKIYQLRFWASEITGELSKEIFLLGYIECGSVVYSDHCNNSPQNFHHAETLHKHTRNKEDSKTSREKLLPSH